MSGGRCDQLDEVMAELALDLVDGAERADALAHVERCASCQAELASLTGLAEQLLLLAPEVPPPLGFELRVLSRIDEAEDQQDVAKVGARRRRPWKVFGLAAAAVVVTVLGVTGLVVSLDRSDEVVAAEMRTDEGREVGEVRLRHSDPPVVEVDVAEWVDALKERDLWPETRWWLTVEDDGGRYETYPLSLAESPAEVHLEDGRGSGPSELAAADIVAVALVDDDGKVWCEALFPRN
jgi:hypothetical protein